MTNQTQIVPQDFSAPILDITRQAYSARAALEALLPHLTALYSQLPAEKQVELSATLDQLDTNLVGLENTALTQVEQLTVLADLGLKLQADKQKLLHKYDILQRQTLEVTKEQKRKLIASIASQVMEHKDHQDAAYFLELMTEDFDGSSDHDMNFDYGTSHEEVTRLRETIREAWEPFKLAGG